MNKKPKNGVTNRMILADFGYPWYVPAMWSETNQQWVVATIQMQKCEGENDPYFENEWFDDLELIKWVDLPN